MGSPQGRRNLSEASSKESCSLPPGIGGFGERQCLQGQPGTSGQGITYRMLSSLVMCGNVRIQRESTTQGRVSTCQQGLWIKALDKNISHLRKILFPFLSVNKPIPEKRGGKTGGVGSFAFLLAMESSLPRKLSVSPRLPSSRRKQGLKLFQRNV